MVAILRGTDRNVLSVSLRMTTSAETPHPPRDRLATDSDQTPQPRAATTDARKAVWDSLIVSVGGQIERALGTLTALALRWGLDPARLGVYTGLRLYLDNTNRSSLGVSLGAAQEIPILRARGEFAEAERLANVAYTTNTITCLFYAALLLIWAYLRAPWVAGDPLADAWTWGLVAMAALAPLKRYQDFLIVVLRTQQEFALTTRLAIYDAILSVVVIVVGIALAGLWGLLASVGILLTFNIIYLHARHPLRFRWEWDWRTAWRLLKVGMPIWVNTLLFMVVMNLDRLVILWVLPDPERAAGLYTIAIMGTSWSLDLAGRIVTVMYTYFQTTLGRTRDWSEVARQAMRSTEAQAPLLLAGAAIAFAVGPVFLGLLMPRYLEGVPAIRPLLPGMVLLAFTWPARQLLITLERSLLLALTTAASLYFAILASLLGAAEGGIVGVAWGMTFGYSCVYLFTSIAAYLPILGWKGWWAHHLRLFRLSLWFVAGATLAVVAPFPESSPLVLILLRAGLLGLWLAPWLWRWGRSHQWGGLTERWSRWSRRLGG